MARFQKIDDLLLEGHHDLQAGDECYFFIEYTSGKRYDYSKANDLISNLKKKPSTKNTAQWKYKIDAMNACSNALGKVFNPGWLKEATLVPIPPSKAKDDPEYDNRMRVICENIPADFQIDVRDLVSQTESYEAAHESDHRPSVADLLKIYQINEDASDPAPKAIGIMDDVLTAGVHYRAMHTVLSRRFQGIPIVGFFIARRVFPPNDPAPDFEG